MVEENEGLKNKVEEMKKVNDKCLRKARRVYEKRVLAFDVRVLDLENLGKELMGSADFRKFEEVYKNIWKASWERILKNTIENIWQMIKKNTCDFSVCVCV